MNLIGRYLHYIWLSCCSGLSSLFVGPSTLTKTAIFRSIFIFCFINYILPFMAFILSSVSFSFWSFFNCNLFSVCILEKCKRRTSSLKFSLRGGQFDCRWIVSDSKISTPHGLQIYVYILFIKLLQQFNTAFGVEVDRGQGFN